MRRWPRVLVKSALGPRLSAQIFESDIVKNLQHPFFVRADQRLERFRHAQLLRISSPLTPPAESRIIWQYWDSGWSSAPDLALFCSHFSEETLANFEFKRLDLKQVVEMNLIDARLLKLYSKGLINAAGLSDVIRFRLVEKYGGYWLDTTGLAVRSWDFSQSEILSYARTKPSPGKFWFNTWFIGGSSLAPFLGRCANLLEAYWLEQGGQQHYFDAFFAMKRVAISMGPSGPSEASQIDVVSASLLMRSLRLKNRRSELLEIIDRSPLHKLSYKAGSEAVIISTLSDLLFSSREQAKKFEKSLGRASDS